MPCPETMACLSPSQLQKVGTCRWGPGGSGKCGGPNRTASTPQELNPTPCHFSEEEMKPRVVGPQPKTLTTAHKARGVQATGLGQGGNVYARHAPRDEPGDQPDQARPAGTGPVSGRGRGQRPGGGVSERRTPPPPCWTAESKCVQTLKANSLELERRRLKKKKKKAMILLVCS